MQENLYNLINSYNVDVLMLVECEISPPEILNSLNRSAEEYHHSPGICEKVEIFSRFRHNYIAPKKEEYRLTIRHLSIPGKTDILLAVTHFPSKQFWDEKDQIMGCTDLSNQIRKTEEEIGHSRTVLAGDLNMNPFEPGIVGSHGLHGVMTREIARKGKRKVAGKDYPYFYNPMWNLFGDMKPGRPGTFFYRNAKPVVYFWNKFDQVLVRPDLLDRFDPGNIRILETDGILRLTMSNGIPDGKRFSDHLPILFKLDL